MPSRSDTDNFSSMYSGTENYIFPGYAGAPRTTPDACRCVCIYIHGDTGDNTDDPGAMIRDDPWCDP